MDFQALLADPTVRQGLIALGSWAVAQAAKKVKTIPIPPKAAPYVAIVTAIITNVTTGASGDTLPMQAVIGLLSGLVAAGGHETGTKVIEHTTEVFQRVKTGLTPPFGTPKP